MNKKTLNYRYFFYSMWFRLLQQTSVTLHKQNSAKKSTINCDKFVGDKILIP